MRVLAGYTRERMEESEGEKRRKGREVMEAMEDCCFTMSFIIDTHDLSVYVYKAY